MHGITVFLKSTFTVFFACVRPDSTAANPRCMTNTRKVAVIIQTLLTANIASDVPEVPPGSTTADAGVSSAADWASATQGARIESVQKQATVTRLSLHSHGVTPALHMPAPKIVPLLANPALPSRCPV